MIIYRQDHAVVSLLTSEFLSLLGMLRPPTICCWYIDAGFTLCDLGIWKGMLHPGHWGLSHLDFWHDITAWENNQDQSRRTSLKKKIPGISTTTSKWNVLKSQRSPKRPAEEVKPRRQYELHLLEAPTKLPDENQIWRWCRYSATWFQYMIKTFDLWLHVLHNYSCRDRYI